ncbi:anhydro-N-acetylmuramic acid kinase [Symbiobacterium terraclitae]|uniref:Anhydro-N-acetylmuramic acid kinase n=1 Tax=Symbiobacterium terraclitae TaxID=557451 RepID=A0ABS4JPP0_9FIRM|nr:anhydro-N-acetylmuramic acid kinase [Symbiobacterium terraclitae]
MRRLRRLEGIAAKPERLVIGLMSGTSVDGIDCALVRIRGGGPGVQIAPVHFATYPFDPAVRAEIFRLFRPETTDVVSVCQMNFVLGEVFADAALRLMREAGVRPEEVDLIGSHGQTVWHEPNPVDRAGAVSRSTLQIGEPAVIAARTGVVTVGDFRVRDVAAGGQGAPLVPYLDWCLLRDGRLSRAVQNIGGIGNVTYLPAGCALEEVVAFDTGPGNMLIDALTSHYFGRPFDEGGAIAAQGRVLPDLLTELMAHPYLAARPPKTTGRELFGVQFASGLFGRGEPADLVATATAFTAHSIADAYRRFLGPVDEVIVGGGGARNPVLMRMLAEALPGARVTAHEAVGINSDAKEAIAFALLANDCVLELPTNVPGATGGGRAVLGKICL